MRKKRREINLKVDLDELRRAAELLSLHSRYGRGEDLSEEELRRYLPEKERLLKIDRRLEEKYGGAIEANRRAQRIGQDWNIVVY